MNTILLNFIKVVLLGLLALGWIIGKELGISSLLRSFILIGFGSAILAYGKTKNLEEETTKYKNVEESNNIQPNKSIDKTSTSHNFLEKTNFFNSTKYFAITILLILSPYALMMVRDHLRYFNFFGIHVLSATISATLVYYLIFKSKYKRVLKNTVLAAIFFPLNLCFFYDPTNGYIDFSIMITLIYVLSILWWYNKNFLFELNEKLKEE